jgi:hypothetical protein
MAGERGRVAVERMEPGAAGGGAVKRIRTTAEQLTQRERWKLILSAAFRQFLGGKVIGSTGRLADVPG